MFLSDMKWHDKIETHNDSVTMHGSCLSHQSDIFFPIESVILKLQPIGKELRLSQVSDMREGSCVGVPFLRSEHD